MLKETLTAYTVLLEFINEFKRRRDLVDKYLNNTSTSRFSSDMSFIDMMKKINMKSIRKKSNRFSMQLSNMLGLSSHQVRQIIF